MLGFFSILSLSLSFSLSLYSSSLYDRRNRPFYCNNSYEGSGMDFWRRRTGGQTNKQMNEGVPTGPRRPKNYRPGELKELIFNTPLDLELGS